jgi:hypothetical protein
VCRSNVVGCAFVVVIAASCASRPRANASRSVDVEPNVSVDAPATAEPSPKEPVRPKPEAEPAGADEPVVATGPVLQLVWKGIAGNDVAALTGNERYPSSPDQARWLTALKFEKIGNNYGSRTTALVSPPGTGAYTLWLTTDDGGELWLGEDDSEKSARLIAHVKGYAGLEEWEQQKNQQSQPVHLERGKRYFLMALQKEGGGGDHMAVAWRGPGVVERTVIAGDHLVAIEQHDKLVAVLERTKRQEVEHAKLVAEVTAMIERGETLPPEMARRLPYTPSHPKNDTGINILLDQAHQTTFAILWGMKGQLGSLGFRVCSSIATLDTVLEPGRPSRIRFAVDDLNPYTWWPNPEFNVVITRQTDVKAQQYTDEECAALEKFVKSGGGLLVLARSIGSARTADAWSMNRLARTFGARLTGRSGSTGDVKTAVLELDGAWEVLAADAERNPLRARRTFGKGRVLIWGSDGDFVMPRDADADTQTARKKQMKETITWLAGGKLPVGGDPGMPGGGGVNIFPEKELKLEGISIYYAANQRPSVLECLEKQVPEAYQQVRRWLPSKVFAEPYGMVICAGGGGGWAIGGRPKASALITYKADGILSIMAHEVAHTLGGPRNALGELAASSPHGNQGEAHAGWFQGKVNAKYTSNRKTLLKEANRTCNSILAVEKKAGEKIDLATFDREKWGKGKDWTKYWWVWQKIEDRYGPTWYTRWYWVRSTRWQHEPGHRETFDEMIEDMSIAVGEDLFPFFKSIGTTVGIDRLERIEFQGKTMELSVAPIDTGPAGPVNLDEIGDFTKPLEYRH